MARVTMAYSKNGSTLSTREKALAMNLDTSTYGTFAEIGAGQEVVHWFFSVGEAAGTIAKSISAYDMAVSDNLYGSAQRYVSRQRLSSMLAQEFSELRERLDAVRGQEKRFFVFADTVATAGHQHPGLGRAWLGIRFQTEPRAEPSEIILHAHLLDTSASRQREVLGVLGVNLIHSAFYRRDDIDSLICSLVDDLERDQVELDMIKFNGPAFKRVDNRLATLQLVESGLTDAVMFMADGEVVQPSEVLYKKPILVERGGFRPANNLTLDILFRSLDQFAKEPSVTGHQPLVLAEMTLHSLTPGPSVDHADFLARTEILGSLGINVLVSRFEAYYKLAEYLAIYTDQLIGIAVGVPSILQLADEFYYKDLAGGTLEAIGRLFKRSVKMYVYPTRDTQTGDVRTLDDIVVPQPWQHLHDFLREVGRLEAVHSYNEANLSIHTADVLARIQRGDASWKTMVPPRVAELISSKHFFQTEPAPQAVEAKA
ncbi:MAG TPA: hypothetical protein VG711_12775 [Phycisphaerales bacterium]|nr:hypothetical protein [Phycisphaerales bacterium]